MSIIDKFYQFINKQEDEEPIDDDVLDLTKENWTEEDSEKAQDIILEYINDMDEAGIDYDEHFRPIDDDEDDEEIQKSLLKQNVGGEGMAFPGKDLAYYDKQKPAPEGVETYETKAGAVWYYKPGKQESKPEGIKGQRVQAGARKENPRGRAFKDKLQNVVGIKRELVTYGEKNFYGRAVPPDMVNEIVLMNTALEEWQVRNDVAKLDPETIRVATSPNSDIQLFGIDKETGKAVIIQNVARLQKNLMRLGSIDEVVDVYTDKILDRMASKIKKDGADFLSEEDKAYFIYTNLGMRHGNGEAFKGAQTANEEVIEGFEFDGRKAFEMQLGRRFKEQYVKTQGVGLLDLTPRNIQFLDDDKKVVIDVSGEQSGKAGVPTRYEIDDPNMIAIIKNKMINTYAKTTYENWNSRVEKKPVKMDVNKINFSKGDHLDENGNVKAYIKSDSEQLFDHGGSDGRGKKGSANENIVNQKRLYRNEMGDEAWEEYDKQFKVSKGGISPQSSRRWKAGKEARAMHGDILADWKSGKLGKLTHKEYLDKIAEHVSKKVTQHLTRDKDGNLVSVSKTTKERYIHLKMFNLLSELEKQQFLTDIMTDDEVASYVNKVMPQVGGIQKSEDLTYSTGIFNSILNKGWMTNPRGADDSYKKKKLKKEGDGGGFGDGGGTVFTSSDSGVFTPTHSERETRKKNENKKKTGIERLEQFVSGNSPERKMVKADSMFTLELVNWVKKELRKGEFHQQGSGESINDQPPRIDWKKKDVDIPEDKDEVLEFDAEPDDQADVTQNGETERIKELDDEEENEKPKDTGSAGDAAPAGVNVQLAYESGGYESDALHEGGSKDLEQGEVIDPEDEHEEEEFVKSFLKDLEILKNYYEGEDETES